MTGKSEEWQSVYVSIMQEIRMRERVIDELLLGDVKLGRTPKFEFCHLELRMICELLAISTLVVHGDIPSAQSKRTRSAWEADRILKIMSQLHRDFFPLAMSPVTDEHGNIKLIDNPKGLITQADIISLYHQCGRVLHRGNLNTFGQLTYDKSEFIKAGRFAKRLKALINCHAIAAYGPDEADLSLWWITIEEDLTPRVRLLRRIAKLPAHRMLT